LIVVIAKYFLYFLILLVIFPCLDFTYKKVAKFAGKDHEKVYYILCFFFGILTYMAFRSMVPREGDSLLRTSIFFVIVMVALTFYQRFIYFRIFDKD